jgi:hypothetical protein
MDVVVARVGARVVVNGRPHRIFAGGTTAHADASVVREHPELWRPFVPDIPADTPGPAATGADEAPGGGSEPGGAGEGETAAEVRPASAAVKPTNKAVRAWARETGTPVPARGPLPDDVVAAYIAAHAEPIEPDEG